MLWGRWAWLCNGGLDWPWGWGTEQREAGGAGSSPQAFPGYSVVWVHVGLTEKRQSSLESAQ